MSQDTQAPAGQSLSDRMKQRSEFLAAHQTEKFPIPGYEDVLEVELRSLAYTTISATVRRNEKIRDQGIRELYSIADQLVTATEGFFEVAAGASTTIPDDWMSLAQRLPDCPKELTPRKAILFVVGEQRIHFLAEAWGQWAKSVRADIDQEVVSDFVTTG